MHIHEREKVEAIQRAVSLMSRAVRQPTLREAVGRQGGMKLSAAYSSLLPLLAHSDGFRVSDLADELRVEVPTISRQLQALERDGLITRTNLDTDRRVVIISLTDEGRRRYHELHESWLATLDRVLRGWSRSEVDQLAVVFQRFAADLFELAHDVDSTTPPR